MVCAVVVVKKAKNEKKKFLCALNDQIIEIIYISISSTHHALSKYVNTFEKFYLITKDIAIVSELCMEFGKKKFLF